MTPPLPVENGVFEDWPAHLAEVWGRVPTRTRHRLHTQPLMSMAALADLIDAYPRRHYSLIHMGARQERRFWREGDLGGLRGADVIACIAEGRMWLNLRRVDEIDGRYGDMLHGAYDAIAAQVPGEPMFNTSMGILISSPHAQVYYHCDLPGQALWQVHGRKRLFIYPNRAPFLTPESLEDIALFGVEVDMPFEAWFDDYATVVELEPGDMAHWPLNAPHRVENLGMLNVSITSEHWSASIARGHRVNVANALLRHRFGLTPRSRATAGPAYWTKAALQAALRRSSWVTRQRAARRPVEFRLDPAKPGRIADLQPALP